MYLISTQSDLSAENDDRINGGFIKCVLNSIDGYFSRGTQVVGLILLILQMHRVSDSVSAIMLCFSLSDLIEINSLSMFIILLC